MGRKETKVEDRIRYHVKRLGGIHRKVIYQGRRGSPDQWCKIPGHDWILIEAKAEGGVVSTQQKVEMDDLRKHGALVFLMWTVEQVDNFFGDLI